MRVASHGTCCPLDGLISAVPLRCRTQVFNATRGHHCQHGSAIAGVMAASLAREFLFQAGRFCSRSTRSFGSGCTGPAEPESMATEIFRGVGEVQVFAYPVQDGARCIAVVRGNVSRLGAVPIPVRIHSECLLGDVFDSTRCQCGPQLRDFMLNVLGNDEHRNGAILYMQGHEGKGIGLSNKLRSYVLQDGSEQLSEEDANIRLGFAPDERSFRAAAAALEHLEVDSVVLYTDNRRKVAGISTAIAAVVPWSSREQRWIDEAVWARIRGQPM